MALVGGAFGRCLRHENGVLMNGISALIKEAPESSLPSSFLRRHSEKTPAVNQEEGSYLNMTMLAP